jgi:uncharacterized protein with ATP-grasp and redox domains
MRTPGAGFPDFTITRRFPSIAASAMAALAAAGDRDGAGQRAIERMVGDAIGGYVIDTTVLRRATPFWERAIDGLTGARWRDLPFFDAEFVLYHALNSIAGRFERGTDVFQPVRREARTAAVAALAAAPLDPQAPDLTNALWLALLGNETDYSQLAAGAGERSSWSDRLVVDERAGLIDTLVRLPAGAAVHVIADNAGPELVADLVLAGVLLERAAHVILHCKPWPMFVSDALVEDVWATVDAIRTLPSGPARALGERLQAAREDGRLDATQHTAWGEPRHFDALPDDLAATLASAPVVVAKGDLNYRRFVGDRAWPVGTPADVASRGVPFGAHTLRVLKSDALVGVAPQVVTRATARSPNWRTEGSHALVQRLGVGSTPG